MNAKITCVVVLSALLFSSCVSAPTEPTETEYTVVLEFPEKTANQLYDRTKMWLNEVFNDPNAVQSYSDGKDTISGKFEHKYTYTYTEPLFFGLTTEKKGTIRVRSTINIQFKDGKVLFNMKLLQYWSDGNRYYDPGWYDTATASYQFPWNINYEGAAADVGEKLRTFIDSFGAGVDF